MAIKRVTLMDDVERLADAVWNRGRGRISDFDSFDSTWDAYMGDLSGLQESSLRLKVFDALRRDHPRVEQVGRKEFFELAGGKSLRKDRERTAKVVVTDKEEFLRKGARRVDFQGLDTKGGQKVKLRFDVQGRRRGMVVFARRTKHFVKGKQVTTFRDNKGKFVSVKRRQ